MTQQFTGKRWILLALLTSLSLVAYVLRVNISVAAKFMMPEFSLTEIQMGQVFSSFMLGYALAQLPAGILGDRMGPRRILTLAACWWGVLTLLTGLVPGVFARSAVAISISLLVLRFILGVGEAAMYPVAARAVANWFPKAEHALANGVIIMGVPLGNAITPPIVSWLMVTFGWREAFYCTAALAFVVAIVWRVFATDTPEQHPRIGAEELSLITSDRGREAAMRPDPRSWLKLLRNRNIVLLSLSYIGEGYVLFMFVFWFYLYLVDVRGFSILSGGIFASLPWIVSMVTTPAGGAVSDRLSARFGALRGARMLVMIGWVLSAAFLFVGASAESAYLAVAGFSLSVGFLMATEASFWSSAIHVAGPNAGAACGVMNMSGLFGGVISTPLVPVLVKYFGWVLTLRTAAVVLILCGILWLGIRDGEKEVQQA